jgi:ABC-type dipeptide/oligopeptide/nickel transport system permease component
MLRFLLKRVLYIIPVLFGITIVVFFVMRLSGDPATLMLPIDAPKEAIEEFRKEHGLQGPLIIQYVRFVGKAIQGDFGKSIQFYYPAFNIFLERFPATIKLSLAAMALAILVGVPLGILAAVKKYTIFDNVARLLSQIGQSIPEFYLGIVLIILFAVTLRWLPTSGNEGLRSLIMPMIALSAYPAALLQRVTRACMLDVLNKDYIRTARSKGLPEKMIAYKHAFKNALIPLITLVFLRLGEMFGGTVVIETIFNWPGVGRLAVQAILSRDYPIVQVSVVIVAVVFVLLNLIGDILYSLVDPRVRFS